MKSNIKPISKKENLVIQELENEVLIYDLFANKAFCLNKTSAAVWQLCNGERKISEISRLIGKKLNLTANEAIVWLALEQLKRENLLESNEEISSFFKGVSRREIVRKAGLSTLIMLPFISSIVSPTAIQAQSSNVDCSPPALRPPTCSCAVLNGGIIIGDNSLCLSGNCVASDPNNIDIRTCQ